MPHTEHAEEIRRKIARVTAQETAAKRAGHTILAKRFANELLHLRAQLARVTSRPVVNRHRVHPRAGDKVHHGPRGSADHEVETRRRSLAERSRVPSHARDKWEGTKITCDNAAAMYAHYSALLAALQLGVPFPLLLPLKKHYYARMTEARELMRRCDRAGGGEAGKAKMRSLIGRRAELQRLHDQQVARATALRNARQYQAAQQADKMAAHYQEEVAKLAAAERTPEAIEWSPTAPDAYVADRAGTDPGASVSVDAKVDDSGASASVDVDLPWYRRYWMGLALAGVVGVGVALSKKGKNGKMQLALPAALTGSAPSKPMHVSRRTFHAKRP